MTTVTFKRKPYELQVSGHAEFNPGNDIVCSAISILCAALDASCEGKMHYSSTGTWGDGMFRCRYTGRDKHIYGMLKMTIRGLELLAETYPDNIKITKA